MNASKNDYLLRNVQPVILLVNKFINAFYKKFDKLIINRGISTTPAFWINVTFSLWLQKIKARTINDLAFLRIKMPNVIPKLDWQYLKRVRVGKNIFLPFSFCLLEVSIRNYWILRIGLINGKVSKKCQNLIFIVNFLRQKSSKSFSFFFHWRIPIQERIFCYWHFFDKINFEIPLLLKWCPVFDSSQLTNLLKNNFLSVCRV